MEENSSDPITAVDAKAAGEPKDERRRERPEVAGRGLYQETLGVADRLLLRVRHHVNLSTEKERDDCPHPPDQSISYQPPGQ